VSPTRHPTHPSLPGTLLQWAAVLGGPVVWCLQFALIYLFTLLFQQQTRLPLHLTSLLALSGVLAAGALALRQWRRASDTGDQPDVDVSLKRARSMALLAMMLAALFALLVVAQWLAVVYRGTTPS
jgi:hypothetical protein